MNGKTIKQIAAELCVSKPAVWQRIKRNAELSALLPKHSKKINGVIFVDDTLEILIKTLYLNTTDNIDAGISTSVNTGVNTVNTGVNTVNTGVDTVNTSVDTVNTSVDTVKSHQEPRPEIHSMGLEAQKLQTVNQSALIETLQNQFILLNKQLITKDEQIRLLQDQLISKDRQIEQLTTAMENTTAALTASQVLHAGTIQRQLTEQNSNKENTAPDDPEQPKQKQGFFSKFFGKRSN